VPAIREHPGPSRHTRIDVVGGASSARPVWLELASREPGAGRQRIELRARELRMHAPAETSEDVKDQQNGWMGALRLLRQPPPGGGVSKGETAASGLPQEVINDLPYAEERRQAHLEARTIVVHQDACAEGQFFHSRSVGAGDRVLAPDNVRVGDEAVGDDLGMLDHIGRVPDDPWADQRPARALLELILDLIKPGLSASVVERRDRRRPPPSAWALLRGRGRNFERGRADGPGGPWLNRAAILFEIAEVAIDKFWGKPIPICYRAFFAFARSEETSSRGRSRWCTSMRIT
jgi:hypothetical protein